MIETTAPETATPKHGKNMLTTPQLFKVGDWCSKDPELCAMTSNTKLAHMATATLEFAVTPANIANVLDGLGIHKLKKEAPPTFDERLLALEKRIAVIEHELWGGKRVPLNTPAPAQVMEQLGNWEPPAPDLILAEPELGASASASEPE